MGSLTLWAANQASPAFKQRTPEDAMALSQTSVEVSAQGKLVPQILQNKLNNLCIQLFWFWSNPTSLAQVSLTALN